MNIGLMDSENLQSLSIDMLRGLSHLIICVGPNKEQFKLNLPCFNKAVAIQFVHCTGNGKNNIDHHIMSLVGYYFSKKEVLSIRILSNDSDFKNIVNFWRDKGKNINQLTAQATNHTRSIHVLKSTNS